MKHGRIANGLAAQSETDRVTRDAEAARLRAQAESERLTREKDAQAASARAEADRLKSESEARMAAATAERGSPETVKTRARAAAAASRGGSSDSGKMRHRGRRTRPASMRGSRRPAEAEKAELRAQLLKQFNAVLQTRETARGLIVNMSDVLFDTGKYSLRPPRARSSPRWPASSPGIPVSGWLWKVTPIMSAVTSTTSISPNSGDRLCAIIWCRPDCRRFDHYHGLRRNSARGLQ